MSRPTWRSRSIVAAGAAAVIMGTGVAALAATGSPPDGAAKPGPAPQTTTDGSSAELRQSVDDLMGQVDALEASLTATPTPSPAGTPGLDDNARDRPTGVSDDGAGYVGRTDDDHGDYGDDNHGEDDDDRGDGDDDGDDHGDDHGDVESDDD